MRVLLILVIILATICTVAIGIAFGSIEFKEGMRIGELTQSGFLPTGPHSSLTLKALSALPFAGAVVSFFILLVISSPTPNPTYITAAILLGILVVSVFVQPNYYPLDTKASMRHFAYVQLGTGHIVAILAIIVARLPKKS